jgi:DNA-binding NtrC family response regulator
VIPIHVDVRVIAATNINLRDAVAAGRFREDLFYRFNVFRIGLPALRERVEDIPLLVDHALREDGRNGAPARCSPLVMRMLCVYAWPGNVRELFAVVQSARIRASGSVIEAHHLPAEVRAAVQADAEGANEDNEKARIEVALRQAAGNRAGAARLLGMGRTTLWRKIRQFNLLDNLTDADR